MDPTETLKQEHQVLLSKLCQAEREVQAIQTANNACAFAPGKILQWYANLVCHYIKEEKHLFRTLAHRATLAELESIALLRQEHEEGRQRVASLVEALPRAARGEAEAIATIKQHMGAFLKGWQSHVAREESVLFPLADRLLLPADREALAEAFAIMDGAENGDSRERCPDPSASLA